MKKRLNIKWFIISLIIPLISAFMLNPRKNTSDGMASYLMGFPVPFITYRSYDGFLENRLLILLPSMWKKVQIDLGIYFISVVIVYIIIALFFRVIRMKRN
jgi:hypothetical protein